MDSNTKEKNTLSYNFRVNPDDVKRFSNKYCKTLPIFLRLCIKKALKNREFMESVFFGE